MRTVVQVIPRDDFKVYVYFTDGHIKLYDANKLISAGGVFKQISEIETFKKTCMVLNHTLAWDVTSNFDETRCLDIDPDNIYAQSPNVEDPLAKKAV